ncbi:S1-like domain-containing RNA-binding protein [Helicobacter macacae]|uniref:Uncharacterized protein n=1 Tax=Helicobacter macacae MIT 99-5501 TaxID=1357400 RepID=V8CCA7_9HELI|nr:S1-like domain-containing RNA-binding protein [Helicobacter macacae]ETD24974.1 hypothetical protein HMPREF2086_00309 [Helicobacter macacae MIT 99-5501]
MQLGKIQTLTITRFSPNGAYLGKSATNTKSTNTQKSKIYKQKSTQIPSQTLAQIPINEVLLPNKFCPSGAKVGDEVQVFIYTDSQDRFIATTQSPLATLGQIAFLRVVSVGQNGVFLDLGLDKDIFMPSKNPKSYALDSLVAVKICADKSHRLIAKKGIKDTLKPYKAKHRGTKVEILPFEISPLGVGCVVEGKYYGLLYTSQSSPKAKSTHRDFASKDSTRKDFYYTDFPTKSSQNPLNIDSSELLKKLGLSLGAKSSAFIQNVRPDGKLDLTLQSKANTKDEAQKVLEILHSLQKANEVLEFHYDSPPQILDKTFGISKKAFKRVLSHLIATSCIELKEGKIALLDSVQSPHKSTKNPRFSQKP